MKFSIVTSTYQSQDTIAEFIDRIWKVAAKVSGESFEIIVVDDGSSDATLVALDELKKTYREVIVRPLTRNFGHHLALLAGMSLSKGDLIFLIDSDLEETPELLDTFYKHLRERSLQSVVGYQEARRETIGLSGAIYYRIFNFFSDIKLKENVCTIRLMTRSYLDKFLALKEYDLILNGVFAYVGEDVDYLPIEKSFKGESHYSTWRKTAVFVNSVVSFSSRPLYILSFLSLFVMLTSLFAVVYFVAAWFFVDKPIDGFTVLAVLISLATGFVSFSLSVVGLYIDKIFREVKGRPRFFFKDLQDD